MRILAAGREWERAELSMKIYRNRCPASRRTRWPTRNCVTVGEGKRLTERIIVSRGRKVLRIYRWHAHSKNKPLQWWVLYESVPNTVRHGFFPSGRAGMRLEMLVYGMFVGKSRTIDNLGDGVRRWFTPWNVLVEAYFLRIGQKIDEGILHWGRAVNAHYQLLYINACKESQLRCPTSRVACRKHVMLPLSSDLYGVKIEPSHYHTTMFAALAHPWDHRRIQSRLNLICFLLAAVTIFEIVALMHFPYHMLLLFTSAFGRLHVAIVLLAVVVVVCDCI